MLGAAGQPHGCVSAQSTLLLFFSPFSEEPVKLSPEDIRNITLEKLQVGRSTLFTV